MENIVGKWKVLLEETKGLDEYGKAFGFTEQMVEGFKKTSFTVLWEPDGGKWKATLDMDNFPTYVYTFALGEPIVYHAPDGTKPLMTITVDGDKVVEDYVLEETGKTWRTVRQLVDPGTMKVETTCKGTTVHMILKKQ